MTFHSFDMGFPGGPVVKNSLPNAGDIGLILVWKKSVATKIEMRFFSSLDNKENKENRLEKKQSDLKDLITPSFNCY